MRKGYLGLLAVFVIGVIVIVIDFPQKEHGFSELNNNPDIKAGETESSEIRDISESTTSYEISGGEAELRLTTRKFPNGDQMLYIEAESDNYASPISLTLPYNGPASVKYSQNIPVPDLYTYRKPRSQEDPLSTKLRYMENDENSAIIGTAVYFKDISHVYDSGEVSRVMELQREAESVSIGEEGLELHIQFNPGEEQFSTWLMLSKEKLVATEEEFAEIHKIGADEFRWITPDTLWSHGLSSIFPASENAYVRSLVRQSGRASAVKLQTAPSRFWENINRHQFASLESARHEDGLWHTDYTSTWLNKAYDIGADYIDSRHNDNIFRSQLKRADLLGYESYREERAVYGDFLIRMAEAGFTIPVGEGYYLIDYYDMKAKTHASLNHVLSLMNYQYDAYQYLKDEKYLRSAEKQLAALETTAEEWIDEEGIVIYQMNLDGTMSGKDYNLVTYYDLLYTKKLREELELPASETIDLLIEAKLQNLKENEIEIEGDLANVENFIGLIE